MMTNELRKKYYEMQGKVVFPQETGEDNLALAASAAANLASIGFPMTTSQMKKLAAAKREDIISFYQDYKAVFADLLGAGRQPKPFYPDFPEGCMKRSEAAYFIDQIIYGLSGLELEPVKYMKEKKRFPFIGQPMHRVLLEGSEADLQDTFELVVSSAIAYSKEQRSFLLLYAKEYPEAVEVIGNMRPKNRENAVACACMLEELLGNNFFTKQFLSQPTDVLRYAAYCSAKRDAGNGGEDKDAYAAIALRYAKKEDMPSFHLSRPQRTFVMDCLAEIGAGDAKKLAKAMSGHETEWRQLLLKLHIKDKAWNAPKYQAVKDAISMVLSGEKFNRPARKVEEAVKSGDVETAIRESAKMPGDFMRRFDKLYRMGIEQGARGQVLDALGQVAEHAGIATVTGMIGNIERRDHDEEERYFKGKNGKVVRVATKNRKAFTEEERRLAVTAAMDGLARKFKGKEPIGAVYMTEAIADVKIPADIREKSGAIGQMTTGSKMPIPEDWEMLRFFIGWTNIGNSKEHRGKDRVDIDLTVAFCDQDMKVADFCGWNGSHQGTGYVYSGDVQDGGPANGKGRAEYVDVDLKKLAARGIRYLIPQVNSYTMQPFYDQPNTCFGVMRRTEKDFGALYEPKTVVNRFVLDAKACQFSPYIIDLKERTILWMNESAQGNVASRGLHNMLDQMGRAADTKTMSLARLIEANVKATGSIAKTPEEADVIFVRDADDLHQMQQAFGRAKTEQARCILSCDLAYISGYLMQEAPKK